MFPPSSQRYRDGPPIYLAAGLEYLAVEVLELVGNVARDNTKSRINLRHVQLAARNDEELGKLIVGVTIASGGVLPNINPVLWGRIRPHRRAVLLLLLNPNPQIIRRDLQKYINDLYVML
ncbi:Histone H2A.1 [Linum grandiflorum]